MKWNSVTECRLLNCYYSESGNQSASLDVEHKRDNLDSLLTHFYYLQVQSL
jgi:hypothetical protein